MFRNTSQLIIIIILIHFLDNDISRYLGTDPEPRPGLSSGHIPHSVSLPFNAFLQTHQTSDAKTYTTFLPPAKIRQVLDNAVGHDIAERILNGKQSVIASCGSGMTAGVLWLGLRLLGTEKVMVYDEVRVTDIYHFPSLTFCGSPGLDMLPGRGAKLKSRWSETCNDVSMCIPPSSENPESQSPFTQRLGWV